MYTLVEDADNGKGCMCSQRAMGNLLPSPQFCYEPKNCSENKKLNIKKKERKRTSHRNCQGSVFLADGTTKMKAGKLLSSPEDSASNLQLPAPLQFPLISLSSWPLPICASKNLYPGFTLLHFCLPTRLWSRHSSPTNTVSKNCKQLQDW